MKSPRTPDDSLAAELLIDAVCERYEAALRGGDNPVIEDFLPDVPQEYRPRLAAELGKLHAAHQNVSTLPFSPETQPLETEPRIGPYTLVRLLGEGGMGQVWAARQEQPIRRDVALKLLRGGLDSKAVLVRFEQERQALALLDHPNIARVLDAGTTEQGRPYFAMELIDGPRLNEYCDRNRLNLRDRLQLFLDLCRAVQHAHQKGIIHRDLKPGNILVATVDGSAVVKVIDFGVAKVLGAGLTADTVATQDGSVVGTWEYMAPEQAGTTGDIDTRADVYSLGVILYELLAGVRPFDSERLRRVPLDQAVRIIRDEDPPRPSTRLTQTATRPEANALAVSLRGDLDCVVMKCLEKDRGRRYDSAAALARDVERYLANEPVEARPASTSYRMRKFVRRNRVAVAVAATVLLAALAGTAAATWGYFEAKAAEADTRRALAEVTQANDTIFDVFTDFDIRRVRQAGDPVEYVLANRLAAAGQRLTPETIRDPQTRARLQNRMGLTLLSLDRPRDAIPMFEQAYATQLERVGERHPDALEVRANFAEALRTAGRVKESLAIDHDLHTLAIAAFGPDDARTVTAASNLAAGFLAVGQPRDALPLYEQVLNWRRAHLGDDHDDTVLSMNNLAANWAAVGEQEKALPLYERALVLRRAKLGDDHADTLVSMNNLAAAYEAAGRMETVQPLLEQAVALHKTKLGPDHRQTLACQGNLARVYRRQGHLSEAITLYEQTLTLLRGRLGSSHPDTLLGANNFANALREANDLPRAIQLFNETLAEQDRHLGPDHPDTLLTMNNLAYALHENDEVDRAIPLYERALARQQVKNGPDHPETISCLGNLAVAYADANRGGAAAKHFAEYVARKQARGKADELPFAATLSQVGAYLLAARQFVAAESYLRESLAIREKLAPQAASTHFTRTQLGRVLYFRRKWDEAERLLKTTHQTLLNDPATTRGIVNQRFAVALWLSDLYAATNRPTEAERLRAAMSREVAPIPRVVKN